MSPSKATPPPSEPWEEAAERLAKSLDADILIYNGSLDPPCDRRLISLIENRRRRPNVLLLLVTQGGDPHVAYRIARCLQIRYSRFLAFIPGRCKSAGTLIAAGAHELVISDHGELGPLDVQMQKTDELWEMSSGLTVMEAISTLQERAFLMLEDSFMRIKAGSEGQVTFKTASDVAVQLVVGLMEPLFKQIDPMHVGEAGRAMRIGEDYAKRLNLVTENLRINQLDRLIAGFSSHSYVIDRSEAQTFFHSVRAPSDQEEELAQLLGPRALIPMGYFADETDMRYLSSEVPSKAKENDEQVAGKPRSRRARPGGTASSPTASANAQVDGKARTAAIASGRSGRSDVE